MAKQSGIHQLRGKMGGNVYYRQKGVADGLVRKINEGMSARVKTDAAFANTRLNAAEFGAAGSFAGAAIRSISQRWRTILVPFAVGYLGKDMLGILKDDSTGEWGQREITGTTWQPIFRQKVASYAKNQYSENFATGISATFHNGTFTTTGTTTEETSQGLKARGADGVYYQFFAYQADFGGFSASAGKYNTSFSSVKTIDEVDAEIGTATSLALTKSISGFAIDSAKHAGCLLVVCLPYKIVNDTPYILQELCSFDVVEVTDEH